MPQPLSRQEFDAIAAQVAQRAPLGLSREAFDDLVVAEAMKASGYEAPLTRERPTDGGLEGGLSTAEMAADVDPRARVGRFVTENLPAIGGVVGGLAAAPLTGGMSAIPAIATGAGLAGVGGAGGALLQRQAQEGLHVPTGDELGEAATEGAVQGGLQAVGGGLVKGVGQVGRALYGKALDPGKALRDDFGLDDLIDTGIREGLNVTTKGAARAEAAGRASSQAARETVRSSPAAASGVRLKTGEVLGGLNPLRTAAANAPTANRATGQIDAFADDVRASHPQGFDAEGLLNLKQAADKAGKAAHRAANVGGNLEAGSIAEMNKAVADRARTVLNENIPGIAPINARTQSLMGVERAIEEAAQRPSSGQRLLGTVGVGALAHPAAAAATFAATSPRVLGRTGIMLGRTGQSPFVNRTAGPTANAFREDAFREALLELLGDESATEPR